MRPAPDPPPRARARDAASPVEIPGGRPMEIWISYVLRGGVVTAAAIIAVGLVLYLVRGSTGTEPRSLHGLIGGGEHAVAVRPGGILDGVADGSGISVIQLGVLVLILTPTLRVAMTVLLFAAERDWIFAVITVVVLAILILGLAGVGA